AEIEAADEHIDLELFQDPAKRARAEQADADIEKYSEAFDQLVPLRDRRDELVAVLVRAGAETEALVSSTMDAERQAENAAAVYMAGLTMRHLLRANLYATRFMLMNSA